MFVLQESTDREKTNHLGIMILVRSQAHLPSQRAAPAPCPAPAGSSRPRAPDALPASPPPRARAYPFRRSEAENGL